MRSFDTSQGPKQECRDAICQATVNPKKIFTLPGREALCVQTFRKHFPNATIRCLEREKEEWETICSQGLDCQLGTVQDYAASVQTPALHHDIIFLDYFSFLTSTVMEDLRAVVSNPHIMAKGKATTFAVTLSKSIRNSNDETIQLMRRSGCYGSDEVVVNDLKTVSSFLSTFLAMVGNCAAVEEVTAKEYQADEGSSTMYFFLFRIQK